MKFSEFAKKLYSAISGGKTTTAFTRELFESIVDENGLSKVDNTKDYSFKNYYNGNNSISGIAKKINAHIDSEKFESYIENKGDAAASTLAGVFKVEIPDAEPANVSQILADQFVLMITEAAAFTKKKNKSKTEIDSENDYASDDTDHHVQLDISDEATLIMEKYRDTLVKYIDNSNRNREEIKPLKEYYKKAFNYYSTKKTLLYAETPHPFYELYVCNTISKVLGNNGKGNLVCLVHNDIDNATLSSLLLLDNYVIIQGTGGMGKSMYMTHLFLSYKKDCKDIAKTPVLIQLRDYSHPDEPINDLILKTVKAYYSDANEHDIVSASESGNLILLLDGLDEISAGLRSSFNKALEDYIKKYPTVEIILTTRPFNSFVSYTKFSVFNIKALSKEQAIELVRKLEFWDEASKTKFLKDLDERLFESHHQFASNPLLLTIMLMTYTSYADVPAKMHHFYAQAYKTMARLHDASKGSYVRPLNTGLSPEEFSDYFSQFCARTYYEEIYEFNERTFTVYMNKVVKNIKTDKYIHPKDFLKDLTDNLCIMYIEGENIYFIHRSFQEYFAALFFSTYYDEKLEQLGSFFEATKRRNWNVLAFDMLYDMIPEKIERFIFLPYLNELFDINKASTKDLYWRFLDVIYGSISFIRGETLDSIPTEPESFIYEKILSFKDFRRYNKLNSVDWPEYVYDQPYARRWYEVYTEFLYNYSHLSEFDRVSDIPPSLLEDKRLASFTEISNEYIEFFGDPVEVGVWARYYVEELRVNERLYPKIVSLIENDDFPLKQEFLSLYYYWHELKDREKMSSHSNSLFDD